MHFAFFLPIEVNRENLFSINRRGKNEDAKRIDNDGTKIF